jgi:hypothetical protein
MIDINIVEFVRKTITLLSDKDFTLLPNHEVRLWANVDHGHGHPIFLRTAVFGSIKSHVQQTKVMTANSITYLHQGTTLVKVFNPTQIPINIRRGQIIGEFMENDKTNYNVFAYKLPKETKEDEFTIKDFCIPGTNKYRDILSLNP